MSLIANHAKDMTSLESQNDEGATPLMLACQKESEEQVHSLLTKKVTIMEKSPYSRVEY